MDSAQTLLMISMFFTNFYILSIIVNKGTQSRKLKSCDVLNFTSKLCLRSYSQENRTLKRLGKGTSHRCISKLNQREA